VTTAWCDLLDIASRRLNFSDLCDAVLGVHHEVHRPMFATMMLDRTVSHASSDFEVKSRAERKRPF
jgi:hypothetical protein